MEGKRPQGCRVRKGSFRFRQTVACLAGMLWQAVNPRTN